MKKILAFCFFPAFVPPSNGGESRLFNFYLALSKHFDVTLLTSTHPGDTEQVVNHGANFVERRIPKDARFAEQWEELRPYASGGDLSAPCLAASAAFPGALHQAYLEEYASADAIIHDFPFTAGYDLFLGVDRKLRIYNAHNCETALYRELHPADHSEPLHRIVRDCESRMLRHCDLLFYCSEDDLRGLRELVTEPRYEALYVPHGMTPSARPPARDARPSDGFAAVFMGSAHPPNAVAAKFITEVLAPQAQGIRFDIIGTCLPAGEYGPNVVRHGPVSEQRKLELLQAADLALNPMASGSGSNVKVLDYMANGLPVLSTSFGMRGIAAIEDQHFLQAELPDFAAALRRAEEAPRLQAIGAAGLALAFTGYTWDRAATHAASRIHSRLREAPAALPAFVLALNDFDPFAAVGGGGTRVRGLHSAIAGWREVVFLTFSADDRLAAYRPQEGVTVFNVPKTQEHRSEVARTNALFHVSADDIIAARHCASNPLLTALYALLRQSATAVVLEHCYMGALPRAFGDPFVYSSHNHEAALKARLLDGHPRAAELLPVVAGIEELVVESAALTIAVSEEDAASLTVGRRTAGPILVVRNGVPAPGAERPGSPAVEAAASRVAAASAVFLGSAHMPNVEAAQALLRNVAPQLPQVQFHLLGSVCDSVQDAPANVVLWGTVDEDTKSAVMRRCALALNPMVSGSGSNVKLADYLAHGLFVVTTEFGQRGYPRSIAPHVQVAPIAGFAEAIAQRLADSETACPSQRSEREQVFARELSITTLAHRFVHALQALPRKRRRVLLVTYRYLNPILGGAEAHIERFIRALGHSGDFDVDVIAPEVSSMQNHQRFSERYVFAGDSAAPVDVPNIRFARFPVDAPDPAWLQQSLRRAWRAQPLLEREASRLLAGRYERSGCTWGWGFPDGAGADARRWAFTACEIFVGRAGRVRLAGQTDTRTVVTASDNAGRTLGTWTLEGLFELEFTAKAGSVQFSISAPAPAEDARPLALLVTALQIDGEAVALDSPTLVQECLAGLPFAEVLDTLDQAAQQSRFALGVELTPLRGPWSQGLESFIAEQVGSYDLVVTHNNIFRPAVVALAAARKHGVPSILIPHAHLDDDFYHFPDVLESARQASLVLAVPQLACDFLAQRGCKVSYLPAGCEAGEEFSDEDVEAFRRVHPSERDFVLVLGRKTAAKGYRGILAAVEAINRAGTPLDVVLIGPDDDQVPVAGAHATYLGRQPRSVVRGALRSCQMLCNMSSSESFGIVLLEAWLAGKPVVANRRCAAFQDLAQSEVNALLVDEGGLAAAMQRLHASPELRDQLAANGRSTALRFDWEAVSARFVDFCRQTTRRLS